VSNVSSSGNRYVIVSEEKGGGDAGGVGSRGTETGTNGKVGGCCEGNSQTEMKYV